MAVNFGGGVSGAISGGQIGSNLGPYGTAIGSAIGGTLGLFGSRKKKRKAKQISTLDPRQQELYGQYVDSLRGQGPLGNLYGYDAAGANQNFDANVSRPAYRNFQENIIPKITGQFRSGGLENSSYLTNALARAGRDVQENLDAQRSNMIFNGQQNANTSRQNAINSILGTQTFAQQRPQERSGTIDQILGKLAPNSGEWFADYLKGFKNSGTVPTIVPTT